MIRLSSELLWFFRDSPGELGLRAAGLEPTVSANAVGDYAPAETALAAAARCRPIAAALRAIPSSHVRVLAAVHGPTVPALRQLLWVFGDLAPLVANQWGLDHARRAVMLAASAKKNDRAEAVGLVHEMRRTATVAFRAAIRDFDVAYSGAIDEIKSEKKRRLAVAMGET